jgi:hypothetical protein
LQAQSTSALSQNDPSISSLKTCLEAISEKGQNIFLTIVTPSFPSAKVLLHTHIDILNLISLKNVAWHLTFRSINRWTLGHMVISTAREKTPMEIPLWASHVSKSGYFPWYTTTTWLRTKVCLPGRQGNVLDQIVMALCRIFDVIKQLSIL